MGVEMILYQWEQQQQQQVTFIQRCSLISDHCAVHWNYLLSVLWLKTNNTLLNSVHNVYEHEKSQEVLNRNKKRKKKEKKKKKKKKKTVHTSKQKPRFKVLKVANSVNWFIKFANCSPNPK